MHVHLNSISKGSIRTPPEFSLYASECWCIHMQRSLAASAALALTPTVLDLRP